MSGLFAYFRGLPKVSGMRRLALWLALVFIFTVPWENAIHIADIGRVSKAVGWATFAVWALSVLMRGRLRHPDLFQKAFLLFLIWNGLTLYWSVDSDATVSGFITYTELFAVLLLLWDLLDSEPAVKAALQAYVLGAFVASGSIIAAFLTAPASKFPEHLRVNALGFETDGIALVVAIALPAAWYLAGHRDGRARSPAAGLLNYAYMPVGVLALALTGTRGATLASIPTLAFVLWSLRHAGPARRLTAAAAIATAAVVLVTVAPSGPLERIGTASTATELDEGALAGRLGIWQASLRQLEQRPLIGVGLDAHRTAIAPAISRTTVYKETGKVAHNTYISVLTETGVVGFILFTGVLLSVIARTLRRPGPDRVYWFAQLGVLAIGAISLSLENSKSVWIFLALAVASAAAAKAGADRAVEIHRAPWEHEQRPPRPLPTYSA